MLKCYYFVKLTFSVIIYLCSKDPVERTRWFYNDCTDMSPHVQQKKKVGDGAAQKVELLHIKTVHFLQTQRSTVGNPCIVFIRLKQIPIEVLTVKSD